MPSSPPANGTLLPGSHHPAPSPPASPRPLAALAVEPARLHVVTLHAGRGTWARLYLDGRFLRESHVAYRTVSPGPHTVIARREGFREVTERVTLRPGEARKVVLTLDRRE
jgi:PEGA domain